MSATLQEIKDAICGEDISGKSKAISIVGAHKYNMQNTTEDPKVISEISSTEPIVSIIIGGDFTWVNLKFISDESNNLKLFFRTLERYLEETDRNTMDSEAVAFMSFIPLEYAGQYYVTAMNPIMWALEPEMAGEDARTLRIVFLSENVSFLESDVDDGFFENALASANLSDNGPDYGIDKDNVATNTDGFNSNYLKNDRFLSDFEEKEDSDDESSENKPTDRTGYVYH